MVPTTPEPMAALRARYAAALTRLYDHDAVTEGEQPRPGNQPAHVFDALNGVRLIISREQTPDGRRGIHVSASLAVGCDLYKMVRSGTLTPGGFVQIAEGTFAQISGSLTKLTLLGLSDVKGIPHFFIESEAVVA